MLGFKFEGMLNACVVEGLKSSLRRVADELDEAEEIVRGWQYLFSQRLKWLLDLSNGGRVALDAGVNPRYLPESLAVIQARSRQSQEDLGESISLHLIC